jgi:hypothetical protein
MFTDVSRQQEIQNEEKKGLYLSLTVILRIFVTLVSVYTELWSSCLDEFPLLTEPHVTEDKRSAIIDSPFATVTQFDSIFAVKFCNILILFHIYTMQQHSTAQHSTVQHSTVQHSTVQYSTTQHSTVQYSTVQCSTVQYSTLQYSTEQNSTAQNSTVQYSTAQYSTHLHTNNT